MATAKKTTTKTASTPKPEVEALKKTVADLKKEVNSLKKSIAEIKLSSGAEDATLRKALLEWAERLPGPTLRKFLRRNGIAG